MARPLVAALSAVTLGATLWVGARPVGPLPPLGAILDPVHGAWGNAIEAELPGEARAAIPGLGAAVDVRYDRRGVPHIFAATEEDAARALGWVVARDRLFQLEIQTRAASGRLAELVGPAALESDRETRRIGLPRAAEQRLAALPDGSMGRRLIEAYAQGVNAWIDAMPSAQRPVEYKLLGARPARWEPVNSLLLFGRMGYTLAWSSDEWARVRAQGLVGHEAAAALFPAASPIQEPIQPNGGEPRYAFAPLPPPGPPDSSAAAVAALATPYRPDDGFEGNRDRQFASNNWAVAPARSASGYALLAGDPHLELTLPSIWYEVHLVVPGKLDVYGVTIPGSPGVIIGFNRDLAWTFTNTGADVLDFWRETVDDSAAPTRHRVDGAWRPIERRIERHLSRTGAVLATDTLYFTTRGPMARQGGTWHSMRWTVLEPSHEVDAFASMTQARSAREFHEAMAGLYYAPAQNMLVADRGGTIAIRSTGHFPLRAGGGDGLTIRDGATSANDWQGYWPVERYPQSFDPAQGFLASANQEPIDPREAFAYLGPEAGFEPWRALQINRLLRADSAVTVDAMRRFQTDPGSVRADLFVPPMLEAARRAATRPGANANLGRAAAQLAGWDRRYTRENTGAVLFEAAMRELALRAWDELRGENGRLTATPSTAMLLGLLRDSASVWWDDRGTANVREDRDAIVGEALAAAWDSVRGRQGPPDGGGWAWSKAGAARVWHLLRLRPFSALDLPVQGGRGTLNPSSGGGFGSSWRMVVELGPELRAWATYPGGQSGNPASSRYRDRLPAWQAGELDSLVVPRTLGESERGSVSAARLVPPSR